MQTFNREDTIKRRLDFLRAKGKTIGFVPTMGALHKGHLSLIELSKKLCDVTVCSIFVNPTQFNNKEDLEKYPRKTSVDKELLKELDVDILFLPDQKSVYPDDLDVEVDVDLEGLDKKWEGEFRPGHFKGVVEVVKRLLDIVEPDKLIMGQKDFQQFTIIKMMLKKLQMKTELEVAPIYREKDGLAMSSRNERLTQEFRKKSIVLHESLVFAKNNFEAKPIEEIEKLALQKIIDSGLKPEYFKIVDGKNLDALKDKKSDSVIAIVAAYAGEIRLIDNIIIK